MSDLDGWALLHSKLPPQALKPLSESVYGVGGLTDVNEGYLIQRLFASKLRWQWRLIEQRYLGFEDRTGRGKDYSTRYYLASVHGVLEIDGREFHGVGGHDNRKLDAAFKGSATVAFKNACKLAGLTIELFKDGRAMDFIYEDRDGKAVQPQDIQGARTEADTPPPPRVLLAPDTVDGQGAGGPVKLGTVTGPPHKSPEEILQEARQKAPQARYADEDAVCPSCGRKEFLRPANNPRFCAKKDGGCGHPPSGKQFELVSYGEFRSRGKFGG